MANYDSLLIGGHIECLGPGGAAATTPSMGTPSADPNFPGVVFSLQPGYSLGEPQPTVDLLAPLLFDGERPWGRRASNRTVQLPVYLTAPVDALDPTGNFSYLAAAVESLMYTCDADTFTIIWTRHQGTDPQPLPLVFDCFRAAPATVVWGGVDLSLHAAVATVTLNITALPYGRADVATVIDFQSSLSGISAPPAALQLDGFSAVAGGQWVASAQSPSGSGGSAYWAPADPVWQVLFHGNGSVASPYLQSNTIPVIAGQDYTHDAWCMSPQGWASGMTVTLQWWDGASFLSQVTAPTGALAAGVPQLASVSGTAPGTATVAIIIVQGNGTPATTVQLLACCGPANAAVQSLEPVTAWTAENSAVLPSVNAASGTTNGLTAWGFTPATPVSPWQVMWYGNGSTASPQIDSSVQPVTALESYTADVWMMCPQGWPSGAQALIFWYDGATFLSSSLIEAVTLLAGQPFHASGSATAPATATNAVLGMQSLGTPGVNIQFYASGGIASGAAISNAPVSGWTTANAATAVLMAAWANNSLFGNGQGQQAMYSNTALNGYSGFGITGEQAITFWAGFGSTVYFPHWCRKGGLVSFAVTLTDNNGVTLAFSRVQKCYGSNNAGAPRWNKIRAALPKSTSFNFANVAAYQIVVTNYGADLRYTSLYLSDVEAVPPPLPTASQPTNGQVYDLGQVQGSARAPMSVQAQLAGTSTQTRTFAITGAAQWTCPTGVTSVAVYCVGGGGGGGYSTTVAAGGGGGGGSAANAAVAVTPGNVYNLFAGIGGVGGSASQNAGNNGQSSTFTGDSVTVTAPAGGGAAGGASTAGGAAGAAGTGGHAGGAGGAGDTGVGAGGGGSSGGSAAAGNTGAGGATGTGGAAVTGGGAGGHGASTTYGDATSGTQPGGGGGGGGSFYVGARGSTGYVVLTYTGPGAMETLIAHRPGFYAPPELVPFVPVPIGDTPNGGTQYPIPQFTAGVNARFGGPYTGTYSVVVAPWSWSGGATSGTARTITVTVTQYEQTGGANYTASASASITPSALYQLSNPNAKTGFARLGEITLPPNILPTDNTDCYFTVSITSTNTADRFQDILFLDTMGSTAIIESPTPYQQMFIEEPDVNQGYGNVMGTVYDRADAVSVLDRASISGPPLDIDPYGNRSLLIYSMEGNPMVEVTYFPRYFLERPVG